MPVIYCKRPDPKKKGKPVFRFAYSQYHVAMTFNYNTELFQDRNPRPKLAFNQMSSCNDAVEYVKSERVITLDTYAGCALNRLDPNFRSDHSWQDDLTQNIINEFLRRTSAEELIRMKNAL
jgi:hypothetical protein